MKNAMIRRLTAILLALLAGGLAAGPAKAECGSLYQVDHSQTNCLSATFTNRANNTAIYSVTNNCSDRGTVVAGVFKKPLGFADFPTIPGLDLPAVPETLGAKKTLSSSSTENGTFRLATISRIVCCKDLSAAGICG